ncbi:trigger factor [Allopontixanthobacter sediminis]|uniref:Trigger factor n=1 Tax=Allopontixanthobacter sediminis TaxID=1689985 RepID=A0A845B035_9SPHN|nr:trigger factor [Allopontixanthobacter sediminis]MXP45083.1 trigger factor [Allopontixanthobacter sediminis]
MQIKETTSDGLKRAYKLTIPAADIASRIDAEVKKIAPQVKMPGFRPGKVPANLVKKMHGEQLHAQMVNDVIRESIDSLMQQKKLRPAMQPSIDLEEGYTEGKDAELNVSLEILPDVALPELDGLKLERLTVPVSDAQVDEAIKNIADQQKSYKDAPKSHKAADGDQLIIDFTGSVDGVEFEGGKAEGAALVIGSGQFIPGFEEQLTGVKTGDEKTITVTFPEDYPAENLKGKDAQFAITVQQVKTETESKADDEFAMSLGLESLDKLKELLRGQLEQETNGLTRTQMKRQLLDTLAAGHDFEVPQGMVDAEFDQIWAQLEQEAAKDEDPAKAMKEIESERDDYRHIAERRVRLGLLLSEIGQKNGVEVTQQEMAMLTQQAAQQYRNEDRERFLQFIANEPMAAAQLRAPMYEDKVVDFLFGKADVTEREVTREELEAAIEAEETVDAKPAKKAAAKKPAAKKAAAKTSETDEKRAKEAASKKAPAKKAAAPKADAPKTEAKPVDKPEVKKAPAKKAAAPKAEAKAPAKAAATKKPAAKKSPAKKIR